MAKGGDRTPGWAGDRVGNNATALARGEGKGLGFRTARPAPVGPVTETPHSPLHRA